MPEPVSVLPAMITPAVLISAAALLLLSTASRLGRVNDRLQSLLIEAEHLQREAGSADVRQNRHLLVLEQLASLMDRLLLLRSAVTAIYVAIALLVVTSIAAGMSAVFPGMIGLIPTSTGLLGAVAFLYGIVLLVREALIAVRLTLREIAYVRQLLEPQQRPAPS